MLNPSRRRARAGPLLAIVSTSVVIAVATDGHHARRSGLRGVVEGVTDGDMLPLPGSSSKRRKTPESLIPTKMESWDGSYDMSDVLVLDADEEDKALRGQGRIVGGSGVLPLEGDQYPFFAIPWVEFCERDPFGSDAWDCNGQIFWGQCGATLVEGDFILAAAHCFYSNGSFTMTSGAPSRPPVPGRLFFHVGACDASLDVDGSLQSCGHHSSFVEAIAYQVHPNFHYENNGNDEAVFHDLILFKLDQVVGFPAPVHIATSQPNSRLETGEVKAIGLGKLDDYEDFATTLNEALLPYRTEEQCKSAYPVFANDWDADSLVCAGGGGARGTCFGDSGGPLLWKPPDAGDFIAQVGISSWARGCAETGYPSVFVNVADYRDWIKGVVCENTGNGASNTGGTLCRTEVPTTFPTLEPTFDPTSEPSSEPTNKPTSKPTNKPTAKPTNKPTAKPSSDPTSEPTNEPTLAPTKEPTLEPTKSPTKSQRVSFPKKCIENRDDKFVLDLDKDPKGPNTKKCQWLKKDGNDSKFCRNEKSDAKHVCNYICDVVCQEPLTRPPQEPLTRRSRRRKQAA